MESSDCVMVYSRRCIDLCHRESAWHGFRATSSASCATNAVPHTPKRRAQRSDGTGIGSSASSSFPTIRTRTSGLEGKSATGVSSGARMATPTVAMAAEQEAASGMAQAAAGSERRPAISVPVTAHIPRSRPLLMRRLLAAPSLSAMACTRKTSPWARISLWPRTMARRSRSKGPERLRW